jgi:two-component system chemotaxis sensor kinase CheA
VRVRAEHLDRVLHSAEQLLGEGLARDRVLHELDALDRRAADLAREWETVRPGERQDLARLGQEVRELAGAARRARRLHRRGSETLRLLGGQLARDVRQLRTVPAGSVLAGFGKMVRELARAEGKEVDFRAAGLDVQADRLVLQALKDPLMHTLRNAVGHGIEPPEERRRQGKDPAGRVELRLSVEGNRLRVEVCDDGRGIDVRRVAANAVRLGLLSEAEAAAGGNELAQLVFRPGLSTAGAVTDLAGRGMGLSVVHEVVTHLQGEVQLTRPAGGGTRLALWVPLSVSTQRVLLVGCGTQTFAVSLHAIERLCRTGPDELDSVAGQPLLRLDDEVVPVRRLADLLGLPRAAEEEGDLLLVVLRWGARKLAVAVDALHGERNALLKDLPPPAACPQRWAGGIVQEDGSVCLVLNPAGLFGLVPAPAPPAAPPARRRKESTILVVDDSLTTRTLERSILEAHGFKVRLALDGVEALAQLRDSPTDLVVTDIQMPRLDGFGLLEEMKKDPRLAHIPVIVVTSQERREDQERGLALGADAYVVKRKFDHEELLETIRQIL